MNAWISELNGILVKLTRDTNNCLASSKPAQKHRSIISNIVDRVGMA